MATKLKPYGDSFLLSKWHPLQKKTVNMSWPCDQTKADSIALDIDSILSNKDVLQAPTAAKLLRYEREACEWVFGKAKVDELLGDVPKGLAPEDTAELSRMLAKSSRLPTDGRGRIDLRQARRGVKRHKNFIELAKSLNPRGQRIADERRADAERELKVARQRLEQQEDELRRLRSERNVHVKARIGPAYEEWRKEYEKDHAIQTYNEVCTWVEDFMDSLPQRRDTLLRDITSRHVDKWLSGMKRGDGKPPSAQTRSNRKGYLSSFWSDVKRRYEMSTHIMDNAAPIRGRRRERIVAIRSHEALVEMIDALEPWPYWQAWAAFAMLAGPRWAEQQYSEVSHVLLGQGYLLLYARKTGRERRVPIERTILKPILEAYLPTVIGKWLFPNLLPPGIVNREKTPDGIWSSNSNWKEAWKVVKANALDPEADYWKHGPREWRHTFGTALGHTGRSSLEISHLMDNQSKVAERFYVAPTGAVRWPLEW
jgi:hypothetical protein